MTNRDRLSYGRIGFLLGVLVFFTSLIDLFVGRLLFRAGPEVLAHMNFDPSAVGAFSRISFTFEQLALFVMLGLVALVMIRETGPVRFLGMLLIPQLVSAAALYFAVPADFAWALSTLLVLVTLLEILGLVWWRASHDDDGSSLLRRISTRMFLVGLGLGFALPLYYRLSVLVGSVSTSTLPMSLDAYSAGIYMIMVVAFLAFVYALLAPSNGFRWGVRNSLIAFVLPTLLVGSILYGLESSFFMGQIFSLVIAMSTDIVLSYSFVRAIVFFWWFLLTAFLVLILKGRKSRDSYRVQQGIGLILILSTSFLFNYPSYLLLGTAGVVFLTYKLRI